MNNDINIENELKENKTQKLIIDYSIHHSTNARIDQFSIKLLEGNTVDLKLTDSYCYQNIKTNKIYEDFQSMLMALSPLYTESFFNSVNRGINNLKNTE